MASDDLDYNVDDGKIDVHTHAIPEFFRQLLLSMHMEGRGLPKVNWEIQKTKDINKKLGVSTSILSLSAPGPDIVKDAKGALAAARQYNEWASKLSKAEPGQFGFFAAVPSLSDQEGCLEEIKYALDELKADGICLFSAYDGKYLGDDSFEPIWKELHAREAVVFIHPTLPVGYKPLDPMIPIPAFDFAHETGRTAAQMVMKGFKRKYSNAKIILSHAGGTLPVLAERLALLESYLFRDMLGPNSPRTADEILEDCKSFYFDTALSGSENVLDSLTRWAPPDRVLFGSDYPYATSEAEYFTKKFDGYRVDDETKKAHRAGNALKLFPRLNAFHK